MWPRRRCRAQTHLLQTTQFAPKSGRMFGNPSPMPPDGYNERARLLPPVVVPLPLNA